ncbi:MAG TPA: nitroreductase family deazaflavin-dependent oxidoreductase [Ktedonobacteraceae bacterium]|nr:nitroreductase family deazaflavin-dependent oxidoreductase [Ktedonobacteraceae bacterium]
MTKRSPVPLAVRIGNWFVTPLVRLGVNIGLIHLLTVRGRKTGQLRTTPVAVVEQQGQRYLVAAFGLVGWVYNLRAAGEATLTRGRRSERIKAIELSPEEAAPVLKACLASTESFQDYFTATAQSPLEEFEQEARHHPVFLVQHIAERVSQRSRGQALHPPEEEK